MEKESQRNYEYCESGKAKMTPPVTITAAPVAITADGGLTKIDPKAAVNMVAREVKKATISKMETVGAHTEEVDIVSHPAHYTMGTIEPKDFIRDQGLNFNRGNVIKYTVRAGRKNKNKEVEDLKKAKQYLEFEIEYLEGQK